MELTACCVLCFRGSRRDVMSALRREEGVLGLWKGLGPNIARNAIINAAELASYDQVGRWFGALGAGQDNMRTRG